MTGGIVFFGDSVFVGVGANRRTLACTKLVQTKLKLPITVIARTGYTSADAIPRLPDVAAEANHPYVIVQFGNNDCRWISSSTSKIPLSNFTDNLREIIGKIRLYGKIPLLCNLQPIDSEKYATNDPKIRIFMANSNTTPYEWQNRYSEQCNETAKNLGVALVDIRTKLVEAVKNRIGVIADDGLHPNDLGHNMIASEILAALNGLPHIGNAQE